MTNPAPLIFTVFHLCILLTLGCGDPGQIFPISGTPEVGSDAAIEVELESDAGVEETDLCPGDDNKTEPGECGCGVPDTDTDEDGVADCLDACKDDGNKTDPGLCGCGTPDCGCLCADESWSCSQDTCLDGDGNARGIEAEAGFFEIPGGDYVAESVVRTAPRHRVWYSFHPADEEPEDKPVAVFFNGGPGAATLYLFAFNTSVYSLDPDRAGEDRVVPNPDSWTRFANVLYIDAPATGFSYPLPTVDGSKPPVGIDMDRDAAGFVRILLRFLARHPALQDNPVLLVGESYGGTRATLMLDTVLNFRRLLDTESLYQDPSLYEELVEHFAKVFPEIDPANLGPADIARQFGYQVLVQPVVAGEVQWNLQKPDRSVCVPEPDDYQCNEASGWVAENGGVAMDNLLDPEVLATVLGVDPTSIAWIHALERPSAYGRDVGDLGDQSAMTKTFGKLGEFDSYYVGYNSYVNWGYPGARHWMDGRIGASFLNNTFYVHTFITDAPYDMVVDTTALVPALAQYSTLVSSSQLDTEPRNNVERPGWIRLSYNATSFSEPLVREIRFPTYESAGHVVTMRAGSELAEDVVQWFREVTAAN